MMMMSSSLIFVFVFVLFLVLVPHQIVTGDDGEISYYQNYKVTWGDTHAVSLNQGEEVQLILDRSSGAGFASKLFYGSGFFHMRIKVPDRDTAGVVTAFYLTSQGNEHDELDFEFLGNREGKPYTLQTNIFADGKGNREYRHSLWFDPTANFHDYEILWNQHQIVFFVEGIPIRVYKNQSNVGVGYPKKPMQIQASLWNGENWATDGGQSKINWTYAPFKASFRGFDVSGCEIRSSNDQHCDSNGYWWNNIKYWQLDPAQQKQYENIKQNYTTYDYCQDKHRYPAIPLECQY